MSLAASPSTMILIKAYRGKLPLSVITFGLVILKCRCPKDDHKTAEGNLENTKTDDRFEFDHEECDITRGK
ncbi:hypothetical protein V6N11_045762 [Hibiscus sabdariffa]|uniref:Uncharacterized protein n=1 Tax=Hibiscus sabdariffa TaxID=183260 RepID=A0ABR2Q1X7_9ROSI